MENTYVQPYFVTNQVTHQLHVPMCKSQGIQRKTPLKTCRWSKPVVPKNHGVYAVHLRRMYVDIFICFSPWNFLRNKTKKPSFLQGTSTLPQPCNRPWFIKVYQLDLFILLNTVWWQPEIPFPTTERMAPKKKLVKKWWISTTKLPQPSGIYKTL